jgi:hypothetical protein
MQARECAGRARADGFVMFTLSRHVPRMAGVRLVYVAAPDECTRAQACFTCGNLPHVTI